MTCCGSKNGYYKKSGGWLFSAKVQNHPSSSKIGQELAQNSEYTFEGCRNKTKDKTRILGGVLFVCGVFLRFWFCVLVDASQKNPISALWKWKKQFSWDGTKIDLHGVPRHPKGRARVRYGLVPTNYAMVMPDLCLHIWNENTGQKRKYIWKNT
jgi:hypothetical protein